MISYAARAVPWGILGAGAALLTCLLVLVERWPYMLWPLQGTAVGLLAGTAVWCYHEPAASVVDTLPRGLLWRTIARSIGSLALLVAWFVAVWSTQDGYFAHAVDVGWQGAAAVVCAAGFLTWSRSLGSTGPARAASAAIVGIALFVALARPFADQVPIFPYTAGDDWGTSRLLWTIPTAAVLVLLLANRVAGRLRARGLT